MKLKIIGFMILICTISVSLARTGARYLIICPDSYTQTLQPLSDWKTKKGMKAMIVPLSVTGNTAALIKNYIVNAYNTWEIRPEYILLAGLGTILPNSGTSDDYYADMTGNYRIELSVGRLPFTSIDQCNLHVAKILGYERTPFIDDTAWFRKGTTIVREDNPPDAYYQADCRYIRNLMLVNGSFIHTDSFISYYPYTAGHNSSHVMSAINDGRAYVVYRGQGTSNWWSPFNAVDPNSMTNGFKLPVVISGTCYTMYLNSTGSYGDRFLNAGTAQNPKGSVAYFGTTQIGSSVYRSVVSKGFFKALFEERIYILGDVTKRAKFILDSLYNNQTSYAEWNLFGDPEMRLWTQTPRKLIVTYDSLIPLTQNYISVTVQNYLGAPLAQALVCVMRDTTIYAYDYTNSQGQINLPIQSQTPGIISVTVTATNHIPFEGTARLIPSNEPYINFDSTILNDSLNGNNDGKINPGETIGLRIFLRNVGGAIANNVQARLRTTDSLITITDSIKNYGSINPGSIAGSVGSYIFTVSPNCYNNYQLSFQLYIQDDQGHNWNQVFSLQVYAGKLVFVSSFVNDSPPGGNGNNRLGPQESARLYVSLSDVGENLNQVTALLRSQNQYIIITDSLASFGNVIAGGTNSNNSDPFAISASPDLPKNFQINFSIRIVGQGRTYTYVDSVTFSIITETGSTADPIGPDAYGYWAYDNTDTASGRAPNYNWFEIGPSGPGSLISPITNQDAAVTTLRMPFTFCYYGQNYDSISVCSNGFLAMGRTDYRWGNNTSSIPDTGGPSAMIAPFWCDLDPSLYGDIYQYYDAGNHRWIVEFFDVALYGQQSNRETFQVIFYDPQYYATPTGDGEIIFMYQTVYLPSIITVGIENQTETVGIQYLRNNNYHQNAAGLVTGRAIKFSTSPPTNYQNPWIVLTRAIISDSIGGNNNGIPEPNETIRLVTYLRNLGSVQAQNVLVTLSNIDGEAVVIDSIRNFGNILPSGEINNLSNPYIFQIISDPADTILDFILQIQAQNYSNVQYFSIGIQHHPGIEDNPTHNVTYYSLKQNHPNPFRFTTTIEYSLPSTQQIELKIYNATGRLVRTLVSENQAPGFYRLKWDGKDESKRQVSSGIYYYILTSSNSSKLTRKMILY